MASIIHLLARQQGPEQYLEQCTVETCPIEDSQLGYRPSLAANGAFLALFSISLILYLGGLLFSKRFLGFSIAMILGNLTEIMGYVGRIIAYHSPFEETGFLMNIVSLSIGPAFFAAGIYFCISRIVLTFGENNSRIAAKTYPRFFIPCDVIALTLQAAGGGMSSSAPLDDPDALQLGTDIMIAGLAFQVVVMLLFIITASDFAYRTYRNVKLNGRANTLDPKHDELRRSFAFRGFIAALMLATILIFTRCVFRVAELSEGWDGELAKDEPLFYGLESTPVIVAALVLNIFNPNFCYRDERIGEAPKHASAASSRRSGGFFSRFGRSSNKTASSSSPAAAATYEKEGSGSSSSIV